jgi:hypothetical protein
MPYSRPGYMYAVVATKAVAHGAPVTEDGFVGTAVKQKAAAFGTGPSSAAALYTVPIGEAFAIITKGIVEVAIGGLTGLAKGDAIYITAADNTLSKTASGNLKYGKVVELAGSRGTRTGFVRIDLDHKASI